MKEIQYACRRVLTVFAVHAPGFFYKLLFVLEIRHHIHFYCLFTPCRFQVWACEMVHTSEVKMNVQLHHKIHANHLGRQCSHTLTPQSKPKLMKFTLAPQRESGFLYLRRTARQLPNYSPICLIHNHRLPIEGYCLILVLKSCILNANIWKSIWLRFVCQLHNPASLDMRYITHQHYSFHIAILDRDSSSNRVLVYCEAL